MTVRNAVRDNAANVVLIADDNADIQAVLGILLRGAGFRTITAGDGEEAVNIADAARPDLVLMDIAMPRLGGLAAARRIRRIAGLESVPIVGCSAYEPEVEDVAPNHDAPLNAFLRKPTDFASLLAVMTDLLSRPPRVLMSQ